AAAGATASGDENAALTQPDAQLAPAAEGAEAAEEEEEVGAQGAADAPPDAPRADEINRLNSTISTLADGRRVFTYFWRGGYRMYLRLFPRRAGVNVYVHAGLTPGAFDHLLSWPFALKLRMSVLEQAAGASEDVASRVWDAAELCSGFNWQRPLQGDSYECVGLGLPHNLLRSRRYVWRDSVLIKLSVFL
ncbi:Uncharacterized protein GBIM_11017, partial [Gryllus bimaculatus]